MKLIKPQDKFILVSDEEIKEGDTVIEYLINGKVEMFSIHTINDIDKNNQKKIISETPDFSLLSEEDCLKIGFVDVERLAKQIVINNNPNGAENFSMSVFNGLVKYITNSFTTAQSLNDKRFSLEIEKQISDFKHDIKEATSTYIKQNCEGAIFGLERLKQSLQQTSWEVDVEIDTCLTNNFLGIQNVNPNFNKPKITNNSIKVLRIL